MNRILKILILIVYTFAIFALAFFIVSITDKGANFKDYKENYKDENIAVVTQIIEKRQGLKIACIEEIAYRRGFINDEQMLSLINELKDGNYKSYLKKVYEEYHELY